MTGMHGRGLWGVQDSGLINGTCVVLGEGLGFRASLGYSKP